MDQWEEIKQRLAASVSTQGYENWVRRTKFLRQEGDTLFVAVPDEATRDWMESEYALAVHTALTEVNSSFRRVVYELTVAPGVSVGSTADPLNFNGSLLNPKLTFSTFVVGSCNQFAHAAAQAVATKPARSYNPLFIYGGVGMGKTHLMHAIGAELSTRFHGLRIVYTTSERFMNQMIQCLKADRMSLFHQHYRSADVLLVDDIQNLASKERTQEEFFHTFNELHEREKQIVISSDSVPKATPGLVERLRSRFEWGLIVDVQAPDLETKMAILDRKAELARVELPEDVRIFIATKTKSNVRELEGALIKLLAFSSVTEEPITLAMAQQVLKHLGQGNDKRVTIESVIRMTAERFGLQPNQLKQKSNERKIAYPRQIAMYIAKELTQSSLPEIGRAFGGKHHTTVLHSIQKIEALRAKDLDLNKLIHSLIDALTA
jgi:chromosomal replication initiator protein